MWTEDLGDFRPTHEFVNGKQLKKLGFEGNLRVPRIAVDSVEEVGLFIIVGGEDHVVDGSLEYLCGLAPVRCCQTGIHTD